MLHPWFRFALATTCLLGVSSACRDGDRKRSRPPAELTVSPAAPAETELGEGLSLRRWQVTADVAAYVARLDPKAWELVSVSAQQRGEPRALVATLGTFVGAALAVNGGYFDEDGRVLGLRTTRGLRSSPLRQADWGVFSVTDNEPSMRHTRDASNLVPSFAVQCGPRLVVEGKPLTFKPGSHYRTAIGYDGHGWVSVLVTLDPVELEELAAALAKPRDQGGLGLIAALNLDGGPSTAMHVGGASAADWSVPSPTPVADAVAVVPLGAALPWEVRGIEMH